MKQPPCEKKKKKREGGGGEPVVVRGSIDTQASHKEKKSGHEKDEGGTVRY